MKIVEKNLAELIPYANNPRLNDDAVDGVAESISRFGFKVPMVIDADGVIVCGHTRYKAAKQLGLEKVPCVVADDLTEDEIKAFRLADNKVAEKAEWDFELLDVELEEIEIDMSGFGFDAITDPIVFDAVEDDFDESKDFNARVKLGDIWKLGEHRLMCGNSTSDNDVKKLMDGNNGSVLFTSPPYADLREYEGDKDVSVENISKFIPTYAPYTNYQCVNLGMIIRECEIVQYWDEYIKIAKNTGYKLMAWNVWDKMQAGSIGQQKHFFPTRHEWVFVFGVEKTELNKTWDKKKESITRKKYDRYVRQPDGSMRASTRGDMSCKKKKMESVLQVRSEMGSIRKEHPATFPVGLPAEYIQSMTNENDIVIEPFCGSGTTLIACEQTSRICYGMELDPHYCDVIINRWEQFTGQKAEKIC